MIRAVLHLVIVIGLLIPAGAVAHPRDIDSSGLRLAHGAAEATPPAFPPSGSQCLPPGVPPLETLHASPRRLHILATPDESDDLGLAVLVARTYSDDAGHAWNVGTIRGVVVIVDDHMNDETVQDWWVDGGMLTDGIPPRLQNTPTSTCHFHRRGDVS